MRQMCPHRAHHQGTRGRRGATREMVFRTTGREQSRGTVAKAPSEEGWEALTLPGFCLLCHVCVRKQRHSIHPPDPCQHVVV